MPADISPELKKKFIDLAFRLEPENLTCDGEYHTKAAIRARYAAIKREWKAAEKEAGRKVEEAEAVQWIVADFEQRMVNSNG